MQPQLCSRCKKNIAVVFITRQENGQNVNEGLCLKCAKNLGLPQVDEMMRRFSEEVTSMEQPLRCSVGVSSRVSKWDEFEDLFNRADNAMYLAKHKGKNRYYVDKQI